MLQTLEHMQIPVQQLDRAIHWYTNNLGFTLTEKGDRNAFLILPEGPMLMLWQSHDDTLAHYTVDEVDFPVLLYRTSKIHELHEQLVRIGTRIQVFHPEPFGWVLKFYDSENNLWGVLQFDNETTPGFSVS
ncbi:VOC family protein [Paenibacillus sp. Marseille-Q4541]|uniref:VOC family protein n=1 Tax=Paenibacillus sp. Marseille-Q4541 TaxID=2831522 RepID=UPI001BA61B0C|nr:VOC family protein [Paenibacillus sp. Marseille-Q4541]